MRSKLLIGGVAVGAALLVGTPLIASAAGFITSADIVNSTIRSKDVKNDGLKGKDLKDNTVTGAKIDESSLGAVPNATSAQNSTTTSQITSFTYAANAGDSGTVILNNFHGLTLTGDCAANGATISASTSQTSAVLSLGALVRNDPALVGNNAHTLSGTPQSVTSPGGTVDTGNGSGTGFSNGQMIYVVPGTGSRVSVDWGYTGNFGFSNTCAFFGTATGTTGGPAQVSRPAGSTNSTKPSNGSAAESR